MMNKFIAYLYSFLDFNRYPGRYDARERHAVTTTFLLCGLYCLIAVVFLLFFGIEALAIGRTGYGEVLLGFAALTVLSYLTIWYSGYYPLASHMVVIILGILCLFMFYTGGDSGTGPMWYFVFPVLAMFIQGHRSGMISVGILMLLTLLLTVPGLPGLAVPAYGSAFRERLVAVYIAITALSYLFAYFRGQTEMQLEKMNRELETISNTDKLSGLRNRRGMQELLEETVLAYSRFRNPFTLIIFDIDEFKRINDEQGHVFGDYVIQTIAEICFKVLRKIDNASRWGGDEFLVLLPGTRAAGAVMVAERLRDTVRDYLFTLDGGSARVTASFGVCEHKGANSVEKTIRKADDFLYQAKQRGRDCVVSENTPGAEMEAG